MTTTTGLSQQERARLLVWRVRYEHELDQQFSLAEVSRLLFWRWLVQRQPERAR